MRGCCAGCAASRLFATPFVAEQGESEPDGVSPVVRLMHQEPGYGTHDAGTQPLTRTLSELCVRGRARAKELAVISRAPIGFLAKSARAETKVGRRPKDASPSVSRWWWAFSFSGGGLAVSFGDVVSKRGRGTNEVSLLFVVVETAGKKAAKRAENRHLFSQRRG